MLPQTVQTNSPYFREGTGFAPTKIAFVLNNGGIGDYINWTTAIQYTIETNPHLHGYIISNRIFDGLLQLWFRKYSSRFKVIVVYDETQPLDIGDCPVITVENNAGANATFCSLIDVGFRFYAWTDKIPAEWNRLPRINGNETDISRFNLPEKYCVITAMSTTENRKLKAETINGILDYCKGEGITPVFLGKQKMNVNYEANSDDGINWQNGIDLRDKTDLVTAACIMARSLFVAGLDNGLLHLASCSDVPVIFGFNIADPRHRLVPRSPKAKTVVITPNIKCRFCQSNMKFLIGHQFGNCLYRDNACLDELTAEKFISAIKSLTEKEAVE